MHTCLEETEWDHPGVVVPAQVEVQAEEVEALVEWVGTVLGLAPAEIVPARAVERRHHTRQAFPATT